MKETCVVLVDCSSRSITTRWLVCISSDRYSAK